MSLFGSSGDLILPAASTAPAVIRLPSADCHYSDSEPLPCTHLNLALNPVHPPLFWGASKSRNIPLLLVFFLNFCRNKDSLLVWIWVWCSAGKRSRTFAEVCSNTNTCVTHTFTWITWCKQPGCSSKWAPRSIKDNTERNCLCRAAVTTCLLLYN